MGKPICVCDMTSTNDPVIPTGAKVLCSNKPIALLGDPVSGAQCVGTIVSGAQKFIVGGKPAAMDGSTVTGTNPSQQGAPASPSMKGTGKNFNIQ